MVNEFRGRKPFQLFLDPKNGEDENGWENGITQFHF